MKKSLFFIVFKNNDEFATGKFFDCKKKAEIYFKKVGFNKKAICIKEAVYTIKD